MTDNLADRLRIAETALAAQSATNAELLAALDKAQTAERAWTEIGARSEASAAALRTSLQDAVRLLSRWTDGDAAVLLDRDGELARYNELCPRIRAALADDAGAALLKELQAARAVVAAARKPLAALPTAADMHTRLSALSSALAAYDKAKKASE